MAASPSSHHALRGEVNGPASPSAVSVASSLESYISEFFESPKNHGKNNLFHGEGQDGKKHEDCIEDPLERSLEEIEREDFEEQPSINPYGKQAQQHQRRQEALLQNALVSFGNKALIKVGVVGDRESSITQSIKIRSISQARA